MFIVPGMVCVIKSTIKFNSVNDGQMKWMEIIELRSVTAERDESISNLLTKLDAIKRDHGCKRIEFYRHNSYESDFRVHIHWESNKIDHRGSDLRHYLVQAFMELGLVSHSLWIEEISK